MAAASASPRRKLAPRVAIRPIRKLTPTRRSSAPTVRPPTPGPRAFRPITARRARHARKIGARAVRTSGLIAHRVPSRSQPVRETVIAPPALMVVAWRLEVLHVASTAPTTSAAAIRTVRAMLRAHADRRARIVEQTRARPRAIAASTPTADLADSVHPASSTIPVSATARASAPPASAAALKPGRMASRSRSLVCAAAIAVTATFATRQRTAVSTTAIVPAVSAPSI
jgi:hypothetical protein